MKINNSTKATLTNIEITRANTTQMQMDMREDDKRQCVKKEPKYGRNTHLIQMTHQILVKFE